MCKNSWKRCFCFKAKNIEFNFGGIVSFQEENERLGRHCITEVVEMDKEKATKEIAKLLNVKEKQRLTILNVYEILMEKK